MFQPMTTDSPGASDERANCIARAKEADERAARCEETSSRETWAMIAAHWRLLAEELSPEFVLPDAETSRL
jgi:hypothetical protein